VAALAAPVLALAPSAYFLGSFGQFFFYAQVVSEAFALGLLVALLRWSATDDWRDAATVSACAIGVVLSWPIWIAPCAIATAFAALAAPIRWRRRVGAVAWMMAPAFALAVVHQLTHRGAASIVTASGAVTTPSVAVLGLGFIVVTAAGVGFALRDSAARIVLVFLAATLLAAVSLAALGRFHTFYMPFKMVYLAVLPAAVLGAVALARAVGAVSVWLPRARVVAWCLPLVVAAGLIQGRVPVRRVHGSLSLPARDVARWARDRVPPGCVDYFSRYWLTGYWLHLDVLGNPRLSDRMRAETFDFPDVAAKWIEGRGLPYAIVEDMTAIPHEIRPDMVTLYQNGSFVVVRNLRPAACR
jgi:hypothetical protein